MPGLVFPIELTLSQMGFRPDRPGIYKVVVTWTPSRTSRCGMGMGTLPKSELSLSLLSFSFQKSAKNNSLCFYRLRTLYKKPPRCVLLFSPVWNPTLQNRRNPFRLRGKIPLMPVRLLALDIAGPLLDTRWQLSDANRAAVAEATRRGIEVALVTGRRYDFAMPIANQLSCPLTMIVNNGALIRTADGETHLRHLLNKEIARNILEATKPWREGASVIFDRPVANQLMLESLPNDNSRRAA